MAYVTSTTYATEALFLEAVEQARSAQAIRDAAHTAGASSASSFQSALNQSCVALSSSASTDGSQTASDSSSSDTSLDAYFQEAADTYGLSVDLLKAVAKQESGFQTDIVSSAGAIGVMQLMPSTAAYLGVSDPYDAEQNILGGAKLLSELYQRYDGDLSLTLAAYNAGSGAVDQYGGVPPYSETQSFVSKILSSLGLSS